MTGTTFTAIFLAFLAVSGLTRWWLASRHLRSVARHRDTVPEAFRERISLADHRKAADYTSARVRLGRLDLLYEMIILLVWTLGGGLERLDVLWRGLELPTLATGTGFLLSVVLLGAALDLPFSLWRTFVLEQRFGFNRMTPALFLRDSAVQVVLLLVIGAPLVAGILWFLDNSGRWWWVYAWCLWFGFNLLLAWAYPVLIAPMFNRFTPLPGGEIRSRIEDLLGRNGLNASGIFLMDGSRRSGHGNAYFTGFGANKRIVFFDTLLDKLQADEVEAVLAHEVGHFVAKHVIKNILTMGLLSLLGLAILDRLLHADWFYAGLGVNHAGGHTGLALFILVAPVFTFLLQPITAWFSRRHEFEADDFAARQAHPMTLVRALVKLYAENAATLTPDPLYSAFHDSHPPAPVRVAHLAAKAGQA